MGGGNKDRQFCLNADFHGTFGDLLHAANLRHGTHGFTSLPKEGVLRIFLPLKIRRLRPGFNPRTWVPEASTLTPRPPKPRNPDDLLPIPTEYKARWGPEMVTTFWRREKSLTGSRDATPQFRNTLYKPNVTSSSITDRRFT
jgi:hypothetical protein